MINALLSLDETTTILLNALRCSDEEKAYEAISVLLMQGMEFYGPDHPAMQQFFPVWDAIRSYIEVSDLNSAIEQSEIWQHQLHEVIEIVKKG
jgi:hypothetical protein